MSFGKKTVDGVIAKFRKAVDDLQEVVDSAYQEAEQATAEILSLESKIANVNNERARAQKIIANLNKLLGD